MSTLNQLLLTIAGVSACALASQSLSPDVTETFMGMPQRTVNVQRVTESGPGKADFMEVPGTFQAAISPRFNGNGFGPYIRYDPPAQKYQASPAHPLGQVQIKELYSKQGCRAGSAASSPSDGIQPYKLPAGYTASDYQQQMSANKAVHTSDQVKIPAAQQSNTAMANALGETVAQPIIYDRYIYANKKSRLHSQGDPIRGDLPIIPYQGGEAWFRPSAHPNTDLRSGAIMTMSGVDNETSKQLAALQNISSGGQVQTASGIHFGVQKSSSLGAAGGDITVTAFP